MKFDWIEYNALAKELVKTNDACLIKPEANWRCAISRAYYSAFCEARKYLDEVEGIKIRPAERGSVHQLVIAEFINESGIKNKIGQNLKILLAERKKVDYDSIYLNLNLKKAEYCIKQADFVIADLRRLEEKTLEK
jgi:uncharacterized protein (UPF0332 family)